MIPVFKSKKYLLSVQERLMMEKAWKGIIEQKRETIRKIEMIEKDIEYESFHPVLYDYKLRIKKELVQDCRRAVRFIN